MEIVALNLNEMVALFSDGSVGEITNLFDEDGDETDNGEEAVSGVVKLNELWFAFQCNDYSVTMH